VDQRRQVVLVRQPQRGVVRVCPRHGQLECPPRVEARRPRIRVCGCFGPGRSLEDRRPLALQEGELAHVRDCPLPERGSADGNVKLIPRGCHNARSENATVEGSPNRSSADGFALAVAQPMGEALRDEFVQHIPQGNGRMGLQLPGRGKPCLWETGGPPSLWR